MSKCMYQVFRKAEETIGRPDGWCSGHFRHGKGRCLIQAVADAARTGTDANQMPANVLLELHRNLTGQLDYEQRHTPVPTPEAIRSAAIHWNDTNERTQEEVTQLLRDIADRLEAEHRAAEAKARAAADSAVVAGFEQQFADGVIVIEVDAAHREPALVG